MYYFIDCFFQNPKKCILFFLLIHKNYYTYAVYSDNV